MIRDLEELLLRVVREEARDYMREAVRCYQSGAYRAAVVLAVAATMDDLRRKVRDLKATGAGTAISHLSDDIERRFEAQTTWERELIDQCKKHDVLEPSEHATLEQTLTARNQCAHPSGHHGSAEQARWVISTCVDVVLARPPQVGGREITALVARLGHSNFFGSGGRPAERSAVEHELRRFRASAASGLTNKLVALVSAESPGHPLHDHAIVFLREMTSLGHRSAVWGSLEPLLTSERASSVLPVVEADPSGPSATSPLVHLRVLGAVRQRIEQEEAQRALRALLSSGSLSPADERDFLLALEATLLKFPEERLSARAVPTVSDASQAVRLLAWEPFTHSYIEWLCKSAHHGDYYVENAVASHLLTMTQDEADWFPARKKAEIVANVVKAARVPRGFGAREAQSACLRGMKTRKDFVEEFVTQACSDRVLLEGLNWELIEPLVSETLEEKAVIRLAEAVASGTTDSDDDHHLLTNMARSTIPAIALLAREFDGS